MTAIAMLGSGEFEPWCDEVERWCLEHAGVDGDRVLIVPTASAPEGEDVFARWASLGLEHYRRLGLAPEVLEVRTRAEAERRSTASAVEGTRHIFFSGGNPGYLADALRGTPLWEAVTAAVARGTAIGGCSAGAVFLGVQAPFVANDAFSHWVPGLGLLGRAYVAPHFDMLDAYAPNLRSFFLRARPVGSVAVGIDERTALVGDGERWHVRGAGAVWVGTDGDLQPYRDGEELRLTLGLALP